LNLVESVKGGREPTAFRERFTPGAIVDRPPVACSFVSGIGDTEQIFNDGETVCGRQRLRPRSVARPHAGAESFLKQRPTLRKREAVMPV